MKLPAFQFYPGDWRKDMGVQSLSYHDRGVWLEILCFMHESSERGKLMLNGKPVDDDTLARMLGLDKQTTTTALTSLLTSGVASRCQETGALMSRRMVSDEKLRQIRQNSGKMGGNPVLVKQNPTTRLKQNPTPSSSSSSSDVLSTPPTRARDAEVMDREMAIQGANMLNVDPEFAGYVWADWESRGGRDSSGVEVAWSRYVVKRWNREKAEWHTGKHRGNRKETANGDDNPRNRGAAAQAYLRQRAEQLAIEATKPKGDVPDFG